MAKGAAAPPKSKAASGGATPRGPPQLYEEATSGPTLVVDTPQPVAWTTAPPPTSSESLKSPTSELNVPVEASALARWGHAVELSPNEALLYVVGGRACASAASASPASTTVTASTPFLLCTAAQGAHHSRGAASTPHVWQPIPCSTAFVEGEQAASPSTTNAPPPPHNGTNYPFYAPLWLTYEAESGAPTAVRVDGGWHEGRRLAGVRTFSLAASGAIGENAVAMHATVPLPSLNAVAGKEADVLTRSHHTVTCVNGVRYRYGGETQQGTVSALEMLDSRVLHVPPAVDALDVLAGASRSTAAAAPAVNADLSPLHTPSPRRSSPASATSEQPHQQLRLPSLSAPPPRAAHGACCLNQRYLLVFGGRHVRAHPDDAEANGGVLVSSSKHRGGSNSPSRSPSPGKSPARGAAGNKRGGGHGAAAAVVSDALTPLSPVLSTRQDVAIYDTELRVWLRVQVVGGPGPCGRYAAAVAAVPTSAAATAREVRHREVLVVGGLDVTGTVCQDAWLLQVMSGAEAELADMPSTLQLDATTTSRDVTAATDTATASAPAVVPVVKVRWVRLKVAGDASALVRHHAAVVVSCERVAYIVGGGGNGGGNSSAASCSSLSLRAAAQPAVCALLLPHLTTSTVHAADNRGDGAKSPAMEAVRGGSGGGGGAGRKTPAGGAAAARSAAQK